MTQGRHQWRGLETHAGGPHSVGSSGKMRVLKVQLAEGPELKSFSLMTTSDSPDWVVLGLWPATRFFFCVVLRGGRMRRRHFMAGSAAIAALGVAGWPVAETNAQSSVPKRVAMVHPSERPEGMTINGRRGFRAYFQELNRLGHIEGKNLVVERYSALGRLDEEIAREIVDSHPDLIVSLSSVLTRQLKPLTATIPILAASGDPVATGIVTNLAKPDGNITGVSVDAGLEVWTKRLQFLVETAPRLANVRLLFPANARSWIVLQVLRDVAGRVGISIDAALVSTPVDQAAYEQVFEAMERDRVDGLILSDSAEHITYRQLIVDLAARYRLPAIASYREFVDAGGLLSYGIDLVDLFHRLAVMTNEVLRGAKPGDIPFYQLTKFDLVLNRATARSLGLDFPPALLATANDVIE
jgi:putative ABC transport system substrate-binding protein